MDNLGEMYSFSSKLWFNARRISKQGHAALYLQVIINSKHKELPLSLKWPAKNIDLAKGCLTPRFKNDPDVADYNLLVSMEISKHTEIFRTYRIRKEPLDILKFAREAVVFDQKECFLNYMESEAKQRYVKKEIDRKTFQNANATRKLVEAYDKDSLFKNINVKWMKAFKQFMMAKGYKASTIWSRISYTKAYLRLASLEPMVYVNEDVLCFPNPKPSYSTTFCNKEEIRRLMILLKNDALNEMETRVLKAFLFTCFTSLRISDVYRSNADWRLGSDVLEFIPKKNFKKGKVITIQLMPMAISFVHSLTGNFFNLPTEQEYNRTLKDIAGKALIEKRLTSHVGRHTFGYLYMTTIGNLKGLQEVLGHSKTETTERYAHLDDDYQKTAIKKIQDGFSDLIMRKLK